MNRTSPFIPCERRRPGGAGRNLSRAARAFSLVEILVVVALLSLIVVGLLAMFSQTQRAFRAGLTQTDVLESGRVAGDLIARELEQIAPAYQASANFVAWLPNYTPVRQALPGSTVLRTNLTEDLFFLHRRNQEWVGIGYFVRTNDPKTGVLGLSPLGVGTLYRFETNATTLSGRTPLNLYNEYLAAKNSEFRATKLLGGVMHFKVRAFDTNGSWITADLPNNVGFSKSDIRLSTIAPGEVGQYEFFSNAVPAAVELEIGVLEDRAWQRMKGLPTFVSQAAYISNQVGRVHVFRQRVQIRNVDPVAYQ